MPVPRKRLCQVCLEAFPEGELVTVGARLLCAPCAERAGVRTTDLQRRAIDFGREIFRCLVADDLDRFRNLLLTEEEAKEALGELSTPDHGVLMHARLERDFRSKRAHYLREKLPAEFVDFRLGPIESGNREIQRFGRSTLRMKVGDRERTLLIQRVFNVRGKLKLEFFE